MNKIDILYLIPELPNAGQERQLFYLLKTLNRSKYKIAVAVWNFDELDHYVKPIKALGIKLYELKKNESIPKKLIAFRKIVRIQKPKVVHDFAFHLNFAVWFACLFTKSIPIGGLRNTHEYYLKTIPKLKSFLNSILPPKIISNNFTGANQLKNFSKLFRVNTAVITNRLDIKNFPDSSKPRGDLLKIACIGRLTNEKRWDLAIEVFEMMLRHNIPFKAKIAGKGELHNELQRLIEEKELVHCVSLVGVVNVVDLFVWSDMQLHTADFEGTPNVIMEAMACARPIVATDAGDTQYLIDENENGFITKCGDIKDLFEKVKWLYHHPYKRIIMGRNAREKAEDQFSICLLAKETIETYQKFGANW